MKHLVFPALLIFAIFSCKKSETKDTTIEPAIITSTDSSAVVAQPDSLQMDPKTHETAMQQDPPSSNPATTAECNTSFTLLSNPIKNHHIFLVRNFDASNFKCWGTLENHGITLCRTTMPCEVFYMDTPEVATTKNPPNYIADATLKTHGIGKFVYKNSWWEIRGANIWKRLEKGYDYYNSSQY